MTLRSGFDWSQPKPTASLSPAQAAFARSVAALTRRLEQTQWLSTAEIEAMQYQQLYLAAQHFAENDWPFRDKLKNAGIAVDDFESAETLRKLPLLTRRALLEPFGVPDDRLPRDHTPTGTMSTSGSTGEPVVVRKTAINMHFWHAITMRELFWHQTPFSQRFAAIRANNPRCAELADWGTPVSTLFATGRAQVIPITADIAQQLEYLYRFRPNALLIYPNVLDAIEQICRHDGIQLNGLRLIRTVGETLTPAVREASAATFKCRVVDNYSSQEVGVIALQCPDSDLYHTMDEALIVEVIGDNGRACAAGEVGRVVVTDLRNAATPLFRYDIGDYAEVGPPCPCGRGLKTLTRIMGRERNLILMPDGTRHWPLVGFSKFRSVAPVLQYQLVQNERNAIEVRLVAEPALTAEQEAALSDVIRDALGHSFALNFVYFDGALPRGPNGKFEEFVCRIQS